MKCRADFTFEADLDDVTKGWSDAEKAALLDGDSPEGEEAADAALTRLVELALSGGAEEIGIPYLDIRK